MSERIHALAQLVLGKASLEECSIEEIQHLIKRYPYFAPAQFLLLQKLKAAGSPEYETQQRKAVLYFHDPLQFDYFISPDRFYFNDASFDTSRHRLQEDGTADENHVYSSLTKNEPVSAQPYFAPTETLPSENRSSTDEAATAHPESYREPLFFFAEQSDLEHPETTRPESSDVGDESFSLPVAIVPAEPEGLTQRGNVVTTAKKEDDSSQELSIPETANGGEAAEQNVLKDLVEDEHPKPEDHIDEALNPPAEESAKETDVAPERVDLRQHDSKAEFGAGQKPLSAGATTVLQAPENTSLIFEPYHAVDYFASQGIKISTEELPKDKLAKQLRSFTDWLKIMKRLPDAEMAKVPQSPGEKSVETLASHSVEESAVITEAMAEVWVKQGNRGKAIETYNKLSLLNPSRKAYFAAKIENLKGS